MLKTMWHNMRQLLIVGDQFCNVFFCSILLPKEKSWADETLSSRCWRWHKDGIRHWPCRLVDTLFFFDREKDTGKRHCETSFESERDQRQMPPEARRPAG